jgi:hypothetical protein
MNEIRGCLDTIVSVHYFKFVAYHVIIFRLLKFTY